MHPRFRVLSAMLFAVLAFALATTPAVAGANQDLPKDLISVLPSNVHILMVVPSINELNEAVRPIEHLLGLPEGEPFDAQALVSDGLGEAGALINPGKPIAVAATIGNVMMGESVTITLAVSLDVDKARGDEMIAATSEMDPSMAPRLRQGNYYAFSTVPVLAKGDGSSSLLKNIPKGSVVASMDLEKIFTDYRSLIEMGLGMAAMSMGGEAEGGQTPPVNAEEMTALTNVVVALMDSGKRYDLFFGSVDEKLVLGTKLGILPGSPLDPGPQPDFKDALELTRILPENPAFVMAQAWSFGPLLDYYMEYYSASITKLASTMSPEENAAFISWFDTFAQKMDLYELPMAASANLNKEGLGINGVLKCDDSAQRLADMTAMIEGIPSDLGFSFKALPGAKAGGANVKAWSIDYDSSAIVDGMAESMGTPMGDEAKEQMEMTDAIINKFMSQMMLASSGDYLFYSTGQNTNGIESMLKSAKKSRGGVDKFTANAAKAAGKDCRFAETFDAMAAIAWGMELFEEIAQQSGELDKDADLAIPSGPPIIISSTLNAGPEGYASSLDMKTKDLSRLIEVIMEIGEQMEALEAMEE
jgi:hypothetical protein